jgi:hypothetical protein
MMAPIDYGTGLRKGKDEKDDFREVCKEPSCGVA